MTPPDGAKRLWGCPATANLGSARDVRGSNDAMWLSRIPLRGTGIREEGWLESYPGVTHGPPFRRSEFRTAPSSHSDRRHTGEGNRVPPRKVSRPPCITATVIRSLDQQQEALCHGPPAAGWFGKAEHLDRGLLLFRAARSRAGSPAQALREPHVASPGFRTACTRTTPSGTRCADPSALVSLGDG